MQVDNFFSRDKYPHISAVAANLLSQVPYDDLINNRIRIDGYPCVRYLTGSVSVEIECYDRNLWMLVEPTIRSLIVRSGYTTFCTDPTEEESLVFLKFIDKKIAEEFSA